MRKLIILYMSLILCACSINSSPTDNKSDSNTNKANETEEQKTTVSFVGVGDNLIHEMIYKEADSANGEMNDGKYDFSSMYQHVKKDIQGADLAYMDQESIIGGDDLGISGYPTFNSPSDLASVVAEVGFDLINTANNHCLDKYQEGINYSHEIWSKQSGIITAGTYVSEEDRNTIRTIERNGITFSFLAYTYGTNGIESPHSYSVAYFDEEHIKKDVKKAKEISDVVIVSAHWGDENVSAPNDFQKKYAKLFADLEVDVVIGEHPHVIQPVTWVTGENGNKTLVVYSLGNFLSGMLGVDNIVSGMIQFDFVKDIDSNDVSIENVEWIPLVTHYTGDSSDILNSRKDFTVYKLSDYTEELASQHGLNGVDGQTVTIDDLYKRTEEVITEIPIVRNEDKK